MSAIKPGDQVMLVWACCPDGRDHIGWIGEVEALEQIDAECFCGDVTYGLHARITVDKTGHVPLSWLIKLDPPAVTTEKREEVEA